MRFIQHRSNASAKNPAATASGICEIDDIKIAVSEVLIALIEHGRGEPIDVQFVVDAHTFTVRGRTPMEGFDVNDPDLQLCRTVLEGVCAEHGIDQIDSHAQIWATVEHLSI